MNAEDARSEFGRLGVEYSQANFFKYVQAGDRQIVELFLDAGLPPDIHDEKRQAAIVIARRSGQNDIARLLLNRGASPEPLLEGARQGRDFWDKLSASSGLFSLLSAILVAGVGWYFTSSYNARQIKLASIQEEDERTAKEQSNKTLEIDALQKLIPSINSPKESEKEAAFIVIQDLADPKVAADLAVLKQGPGAIKALAHQATAGSPSAKNEAVTALKTIVSSGTPSDSKLAKQTLEGLKSDSAKTDLGQRARKLSQDLIVFLGEHPCDFDGDLASNYPSQAKGDFETCRGKMLSDYHSAAFPRKIEDVIQQLNERGNRQLDGLAIESPRNSKMIKQIADELSRVADQLG